MKYLYTFWLLLCYKCSRSHYQESEWSYQGYRYVL